MDSKPWNGPLKFEPSNTECNSENGMHTTNEAIEILINNFMNHPSLANSEQNLNVFDMLQEFWQMKCTTLEIDEPLLKYEFLERPGTPYVCFVTLPGGACFATFQVSLF